ncbi:MAG: LysR family transcriptional regulator [Pseudomonadota bacterium]
MNLAWDDIRTIGFLVETGSLAGAGAALGINYTTVARRIARAEAALGETLFERLADGYQPTDAARLIAGHAEKMAREEDQLLRRLSARGDRLEGPLTVTAPQLLIAYELAPVLTRFSALHPQIELTVKATNDILDLSRREADLAIRISREPGDTLKGMRLAEQQTASFASPDWARRIEADPQGMIDWVVFAAMPSLPDIVMHAYPGSRVRYRFDDMGVLLSAAEAGLGVVRCPMFLGRTLPGLVQVPLLPPQSYAEIWVVAHTDLWAAPRVAAFRDVLVPHMRSRRAHFVA